MSINDYLEKEQRLRSEVSRLQNENRELQQRAASAAPSGYPPMQNGNKNFFEKEIQKLKLEKNKVEEEKRRIEGEKRKVETELSNMKTGQYGKPMPNFSGGHQEWFKAGISDRKKVP